MASDFPVTPADATGRRLRIAALAGALPMAAATLLSAGTTDFYRARMLLVLLPFVAIVMSGWSGARAVGLPSWMRWGAGLVFGGYALSLLFAGVHWPLALVRCVELGLWLLVALSVARLVATAPRLGWVFVAALGAAFLISAGLVAVRVLTLEDPARHPWAVATPGYFHLRHLGHFAAPVLVLGHAALAAGAHHRWGRWLIGLALVVGWAALFWSGSRAGVLATVGGLAGLAFLQDWAQRRFLLWTTVVVFVVGALLSIAFVPAHPSLGVFRMIEASAQIEEGADRFASGRLALWGDAFARLREHPILGLGPDQYRFAAGLPARVFEPHNAVLQVWLEGGLVALAGFALLVLGFLREAWSPASRSPLGRAAVGALLALLVAGLADGIAYKTISSLAGAACLGLWLGAIGAKPLAAHWGRLARVATWSLLAGGLAGFGLTAWHYTALQREAPACDSFLVRSVRAFPTETLGMLNWLRAWESEDAACDLEDWYEWLMAEAPAAYFYKIHYGFYLARQGEAETALALVDEGLAETPANLRPRFAERYAEARAALEARTAAQATTATPPP
ncbi:MAG: O-antigen ligase family protein [Opitutales bacterium]